MTRQLSMVAAAAMLATVLTIGTAVTGMAQTPTPSHDKMSQHKDGKPGMKDMHGMSGMMTGPHHVLAMAYHQNLATFAKSLHEQTMQASSVNVEFARAAVTEMLMTPPPYRPGGSGGL